MSPITFPSRSEELSPALLTALLSERHPGVRVEGLRVVEQAHCDTGSASTAGRAVLDLDYAPGSDVGLPSRVVLKTVLIRPGAPASMYQNEVRFYRELRPELEVEAPQVFASVFDEASGGFGLVMEDLRERGAHFPNATQAMNRSQIESVLGELARLHARFWQSPRLKGDLDWLWTPCSGGFYDFLQGEGGEFLRAGIAGNAYKQELLVRLGRGFDEVWAALWKAQTILASEPTTLLHGDTHYGNTYLLPGDRVGLLDWQLMIRGQWAHDVSYVMITALDIVTRRKQERELLDYYREQLAEAGVASPPDPEETWRVYRQAAIWGFLIGWMITPVENYGESILRANLERLTTALEDLETFELLGF
jgi:hypothetical protein